MGIHVKPDACMGYDSTSRTRISRCFKERRARVRVFALLFLQRSIFQTLWKVKSSGFRALFPSPSISLCAWPLFFYFSRSTLSDSCFCGFSFLFVCFLSLLLPLLLLIGSDRMEDLIASASSRSRLELVTSPASDIFLFEERSRGFRFVSVLRKSSIGS